VGSVCPKKCDSAPPSVMYTLSQEVLFPFSSFAHQYPTSTHLPRFDRVYFAFIFLGILASEPNSHVIMGVVVASRISILMISFVCILSIYMCEGSGFRALVKLSVRSYLVGNAGSRPISEAKQPWACLVLGWGTTGEAHVLYSLFHFCA
jgi:hypothetical protein